MKPKPKSKAEREAAWATATKMRTVGDWPCPHVNMDLSMDVIKDDYERLAKQYGATGDYNVCDSEITEALTVLAVHLHFYREELANSRFESAVDWACRAGATWMALKQKLEWVKSPGRGEHPIWSIAREIYAKDKEAKQTHICQLALDEFKQRAGEECEMTRASMEKHFRKRVIDHR